jgi:Stage II sporulation protein E (SpoIIE)
VFLADASGHGGAAAVLAALSRMVLHSCPLTSGQDRGPFCPIHSLTQTPPIILSRLNRVLVENSLDEQFMMRCSANGNRNPPGSILLWRGTHCRAVGVRRANTWKRF